MVESISIRLSLAGGIIYHINNNNNHNDDNGNNNDYKNDDDDDIFADGASIQWRTSVILYRLIRRRKTDRER